MCLWVMQNIIIRKATTDKLLQTSGGPHMINSFFTQKKEPPNHRHSSITFNDCFIQQEQQQKAATSLCIGIYVFPSRRDFAGYLDGGRFIQQEIEWV